MEENAINFTAILLAGGKSVRMGRDKAELPFGETTMLQYQVNKLREIGASEILISGAGRLVPGTWTVPDRQLNQGPLAGICACMECAVCSACLVLSVDAPLVPTQTLRQLVHLHGKSGAEACILRHGEILEPLIGMYSKSLLTEAEAHLKVGHNSIKGLLESVSCCYLEYTGDEILVSNCNTPETYQQMLQILHE